MKHNLKIGVPKKPLEGGIVQCRSVTMREKLFTRLFGREKKVTILIHGNSVEMVYISDVPGGRCCR